MGARRGDPDRVQMGLRIPRDLHERMDAAATERDVSLNYLAARAFEVFLAQLLPADQITWTRKDAE